MNKNFIAAALVLALSLTSFAPIYAASEQTPIASFEMEETEPTAVPAITEPTVSAEPAAARSLDLEIELKQHTLSVESTLKMDLYDEANNLLSSASAQITPKMNKVSLHFDINGKASKFIAKFSGVQSIQFYDKVYTPESEDFVIEAYQDNFIMTADTVHNKEVFLFNKKGAQMYLSPGSFMAGDKKTAMIPVKQVAEALGLKVAYRKDYDTVDVYIGDKILSYKLGSTLMNVFGEDKYTDVATCVKKGTAFVTVQSLTDAFNVSTQVWENDDRRDIMLQDSTLVSDYYNQHYVNRAGIASSTNYLIWVSKSEYKVRTYKGSKGRWELIKTAPCAIGAPSTPTVTGQFQYISKERWDYGSYYVGPVMRFYNGYALHSTLLNYNGTEYDGRVGVQISHGCVRMHPADINWLANNIPYKTKIFITD